MDYFRKHGYGANNNARINKVNNVVIKDIQGGEPVSEQKRMYLRNWGEALANLNYLTLQISVAFAEGLSAANAIREKEETDSQ